MSWKDDIALKKGNSFGINEMNENVGDKFSLLEVQIVMEGCIQQDKMGGQEYETDIHMRLKHNGNLTLGLNMHLYEE